MLIIENIKLIPPLARACVRARIGYIMHARVDVGIDLLRYVEQIYIWRSV